MKKSIITLFFLIPSILVLSQNITLDNINGYLAGKWRDLSDSSHVLGFTEQGAFYETPVKFTINSKTDTLKGIYKAEYQSECYFGIEDTIGSDFVMIFDPAEQPWVEFKRRVLMLHNNFLEIATWKGGPYLFMRKK